MTLPISAIVLTYNEEKNIKKCLDSIINRVDEIIVIDSFSDDKTLDIARSYTDKIYQNYYESHPSQWRWILNNVHTNNNWIFAVDADFTISEKLWEEINKRFADLNNETTGFYVKHKQIFMGRPILHGGMYPNYWLRIFKKNRVTVDKNDFVDIHFYTEGKTEKLEFDIIEQNLKDEDIGFWIGKQKNFAKKNAQEVVKRIDKKCVYSIRPNILGTPDQKKLFLKMAYYKLPPFIRAILYFLYRYILRLGFLDGWEGFVYHFTQGFLYRFMADVEILKIKI